MKNSTISKIARAFGPTRRLDRAHFHGGVLGPVHLCDDRRCDGAGRGSTGQGA
ncbi:MAG TPA: hypothetical protein VIL49_17375 [Capillimicrobium sp.]|jgi:hypothetical protein